MARVDIERLGGFAGFGGPGSRLQSRGTVDTSDLSESDRNVVELLFAQAPPAWPASADGFIYRLTRQTGAGPQTIDVGEQHVPDAVKAAVKDTIV